MFNILLILIRSGICEKKICLSNSVKDTKIIIDQILDDTKMKLFFLIGEVGVGKTEIAKHMINVLTDNSEAVSPTFSLVNEYYDKNIVFHFDLYRVSSFNDRFFRWFYEYYDQNAFLIIEWGEILFDLFMKDCVKIEISKDLRRGNKFRIITAEEFVY